VDRGGVEGLVGEECCLSVLGIYLFFFLFFLSFFLPFERGRRGFLFPFLLLFFFFFFLVV